MLALARTARDAAWSRDSSVSRTSETGHRPLSTAPPSPVPSSVDERASEEEEDDEKSNHSPLASDEVEERYARLEKLLEKSKLFATLLKERMDQARANMEQPDAGRSSKRIRVDKGGDEGVQEEDLSPIEQPSLITGAKLKPYQLEGLAWMASLYENGISGILADEMGLGKTLQTIAFNAFFRERSNKPFLVVCPLSVLHNWGAEFAKFAPKVPVCTYHGTPEERAELRRTVLIPEPDLADDVWAPGCAPAASRKSSLKKTARGRPPAKKPAPQSKSTFNGKSAGRGRGNGKGQSKRKVTDLSDDDEEETGKAKKDKPHPSNTFPVVLTTYEMIIRDKSHLSAYSWGYIVVDEGHRLKNFDSKLMREIKQYSSAARMVLTGTPLQNNLAELWSLLNFVLPDIFSDLDSFQQWFDLSPSETGLTSSRTTHIVNSLHAILKPFLLRRLKVDVETGLPPKKEYVLYAPLTERQREIYDAIVSGSIRAFLLRGKDESDPVKKAKTLSKADVDAPRQTRSSKPGKEKGKKKNYNVDGDDDEYFERLENGNDKEATDSEQSAQEVGKEWAYKSSLKKVNNMSLQNTVMQLRKVCSHPFLFDWPIDPVTQQQIVDEQLVEASGKMMVLERLLDALFARGHKVLVFSQFKIGLDIIEDWATEFKGWPLCRIDGQTDAATRREEMARFQEGGDAPDAPRLFLLTTRAGGQGINLTAADTVIFYDQDWNPQMDAQAADRAHRIGQTKPVLVFRLVSKHTIETRIMQRATEKRQLEAMVIAKGKFKAPTAAAARGGKGETMAEIAASLLKLEGEQIDVIASGADSSSTERGKRVLSDGDLDALLDRSAEVFAERGSGWTGGAKENFAVFQAPVDTGNGALANMLGEEIPG